MKEEILQFHYKYKTNKRHIWTYVDMHRIIKAYIILKRRKYAKSSGSGALEPKSKLAYLKKIQKKKVI